MVSFIQGRYEDYLTRYPTPASRPIDGTLYYLIDSDNHAHIIKDGKEYSVSATVYNNDGTVDTSILSVPIEFHHRSEYEDDPTIIQKPNTAVFLFEDPIENSEDNP